MEVKSEELGMSLVIDENKIFCWKLCDEEDENKKYVDIRMVDGTAYKIYLKDFTVVVSK